MIREFGKSNDNAPVIIETKPLDNTVLLDEPTEGMRPFHVEADDEDNNNTAKMVGGVLVALLLAGGGIYAYEMTSHNTAGQQLALKTPTQNKAALDQTASAPQQPATDNTAPDNSAAPSPTATPTPPRAHRVIKSADNGDAGTAMASAPAPAPVQQDAAINAPMTVTPETAPAPEQSAPVNQTATIQQPLTAPNVTDQSSQPTSAVANNDLPQPSAPVVQPQLVTPDLPAPQATPQTATPQAQVPADQAQLPSAQ